MNPNSSTNSPLCPSSIHDPVVVFSPHPDDETLAMAGVIRKAKEDGRTVIVEFMTNGDQSGTCTGGTTGTSGTCGQERCVEGMLAAQKLGVDGVTVNNFGDKSTMANWFDSTCPPSGYVPDPNKVPTRVSFWRNNPSYYSGCLSMRGTAGREDYNETGSAACHADHLAVRMALQNANYADTKWYSVYAHAWTSPYGNHFNIEPLTAAECDYSSTTCNTSGIGVYDALTKYQCGDPTSHGYGGAAGSFNNRISDCQTNVASDLALTDAFTSCFGGGSNACGEASCVAPQGDYVSHYTGSNCTGTESYYTPYFTGGTTGVSGNCQPNQNSGAVCGTQLRTVTNISARINGSCSNYWPSGNTLSGFVTVYRSSTCREASCVSPQGDYVSHFTGSGCTGIESYYTPYFTGGTTGVSGNCQPNLATGAVCGTVLKTMTNISARINGQCTDYWPSGNTLSGFVTVYR